MSPAPTPRPGAARPRARALILTALVLAPLLAACGSSSRSSAGGDVGVKFADCMRSHGVSDFPDPTPGGGIQIPNGVNPRAPAFQAAQKACARFMPSGPGRLPASESQKLMMLRLSQCMRRHGLSAFPDPVSSPPRPGAGFGLAFGRPGSFIAVPQSMLGTPAFTQAAAACGIPGGGGGGVRQAPPA